MKKLLIIFLISFFVQGYSQNLVSNGDMEQYDHHYSYICFDSTALTATNWYCPTKETPDYCNSNSCWSDGVPQNYYGYQFAYSGNGYFLVSMYTKDDTYESREYIQVELSDSLKAGRKYNVKFYVSLCDSAQYAIDDIGALFTISSLIDTVTNPPPVILAMPQVINQPGNYLTSRTEWMLISDTLIAAGSERYITIGNFKNDANIDTLFVPGGSENTSYGFGSAYYIDDVSVELDTTQGVEDIDVNERDISIYPNPAHDRIIISNTITLQNQTLVSIYNMQGQQMISAKHYNQSTIELDVSELSIGIYLVKIQNENGVVNKKLVIQ